MNKKMSEPSGVTSIPEIMVEDYLGNDEMAVSVIKKKYLEYPEQPISEFFYNVISNITNNSIENKKEDKERFIQDCYEDWINGVWKGAGSILSASVLEDKKISVFNCSGLVIPEDSIEGISDTRKHAIKMAAHRQGFGVLFDALRPKGSKINNSALISEGAVHWMKSFDNIGYEAGQRGRMPALLFALSINHPDVEDFITCKDDVNHIKNANISVQITDEFMEKVRKDEMHELVFETESGHTIAREVRARDLFEKIAKQAWKNGEPGVQFIDKMRTGSIQEALSARIMVTNACSEKPLPDHSVCCLAPMNMEFVPNPFTEQTHFHFFMWKTVKMMVRFMDDVIQYELDRPYKHPTEKQKEQVKNLREIGLGIMNLHKFFYKNGVAYGSKESIELTHEFFKYYLYYAFKASCELAKERGPCEAWKKCKEEGTLEKNITPYLEMVFWNFPDLKEMYLETGIRNAALLSIAPTGTTAMTFPGNLSAGIEPLMGYAYWRRTRALSSNQEYDYFFVLPHSIKNMLLESIPAEHEDHQYIKDFPVSYKDTNGEEGKRVISMIKKYLNADLLVPAHEVDPFQKILVMQAAQKWIDAAISVTFNLPFTFSEERVQGLYMDAWEKGLKSMTVYRDGSREGIYVFVDPVTHAKELKALYGTGDEGDRPEEIQYHFAPKRPEELPCAIHHPTIKGDQWVVLVGLLNGTPYEIFAGKKNEDFDIDKNIKEGIIFKRNRGKYSLKIKVGEGSVTFTDIAGLFMNDEYKALTRLISLALRHGVYTDFIVNQLKKGSDFVSDFMAVVSRILNKYNMNIIQESMKMCPSCGEVLVREGGCMKCSADCGYSRCD